MPAVTGPPAATLPAPASRDPGAPQPVEDARPFTAGTPPAVDPAAPPAAAASRHPGQPTPPPPQAAPPPDATGEIAALREALRLSPDDDQARHHLARALLAHAPAPGPGSTPASTYIDLGRSLVARGQMAQAVSWLREALRLEPGRADARAALGIALHGMGDLDAAMEELRAAVRGDPGLAEARLALATGLIARQQWPAARSELDEVLRRNPDDLQASYSLGIVRYALGDSRGAIEAYRRVLALDPRHQDARFNLALLLRLSHRDAEATAEFLAAARAGVARAQYFAGAAHAAGLGVERDLALAVAWWFRAAEQGEPQAADALAELRQVALGRGRRNAAERAAAEQAFRDFRAALWASFPELPREGESVGDALLRQGRAREALPVLIREASALGEHARRLLARLYEHGVPGQLPARDPRVLRWFQDAAAEGHDEARRLLRELSAASAAGPATPRP